MQSLIDRILEPNEAINLIVENNSEAVFRNLMILGYSVSNMDEFWDVVNILMRTPEGVVTLMRVLDVPLVENNMDPELVKAVKIIASGQQSDVSKDFLGMSGEQWNNTLGAVAAAALPVVLAQLGQGADPAAPGNYVAPTPPRPDYTPLYIGIGVVVGAVLLILAISWSKKKK